MNNSGNNRLLKFIKPTIAILSLAAGVVFLFIPFIPLGYILVIAGLFLLATEIPALRKILDKINEKDKKNRVEKVVKKVEETESKLNEIIDEETKDEDDPDSRAVK